MGPRKIIKRILLVGLLVLIVVNLTVARLPADPPLPAGSKFAQIDDRKIHYVEKPGREPAVIMIHGLPGTWGDWDAVSDELAGRRTIAIDRPGFAFSSGEYMPFDDQVVLLNQLARKLGLKRPVLAGHSYGGALVLAYAAKYDEISGVVAVDPGVASEKMKTERLVQANFIKAMQLPVLQQVGAVTSANVIKRFSAKSGGKEAFDPDPVNEEWTDRMLSLNLKERDAVTWADEVLNYDSAVASQPAEFRLIDEPVYVLQGRDDQLVSAPTVEAAAKSIRGARLKLLSGGHMVTYTHPDAVAAAIVAAARKR